MDLEGSTVIHFNGYDAEFVRAVKELVKYGKESKNVVENA